MCNVQVLYNIVYINLSSDLSSIHLFIILLSEFIHYFTFRKISDVQLQCHSNTSKHTRYQVSVLISPVAEMLVGFNKMKFECLIRKNFYWK